MTRTTDLVVGLMKYHFELLLLVGFLLIVYFLILVIVMKL